MNALIAGLVAPCADSLIIHAAGLSLAGRGFLVCGESGSGKSTLAALLIPLGCDYLTDEIARIPVAGDARLIGFARSLVLKAGSDFIWCGDAGRQSGIHTFPDGTAWLPAESLRVGCVRDADLHPDDPQNVVKPTAVIASRYQPGAVFDVKPMSKAQTAFTLLQNLVNARNLPSRGMPAVMRLASLVRGYSIVYSDAEQVAAWLR
jgi:hypothetical protein